MAALSGKVARIKLCSQAVTKSTDEAATLSTDGVTLSIDAAAKRHWARSLTSTPVVYIAGSTATPVGSTNYSVDYAAGTLTFATSRSTSDATAGQFTANVGRSGALTSPVACASSMAAKEVMSSPLYLSVTSKSNIAQNGE